MQLRSLPLKCLSLLLPFLAWSYRKFPRTLWEIHLLSLGTFLSLLLFQLCNLQWTQTIRRCLERHCNSRRQLRISCRTQLPLQLYLTRTWGSCCDRSTPSYLHQSTSHWFHQCLPCNTPSIPSWHLRESQALAYQSEAGFHWDRTTPFVKSYIVNWFTSKNF